MRRLLLPLALLAAQLAAVPPPLPAAAPQGAKAFAPARDPRARAAHLEAELAAARSDRLYLVLDPWTRRLDLKADGLLLRRFQLERALWGRPWLVRREPAWAAASFALVTEIPEPDRPRIAVGAASKGVALTAAERRRDELLAQAPTHFRLRFEPGLEVEPEAQTSLYVSVRGEAGVEVLPGRLYRARHRLVEGWENAGAWLLRRPLPPRVVLILRPAEAQRLFLALQPEMRLLVKAP